MKIKPTQTERSMHNAYKCGFTAYRESNLWGITQKQLLAMFNCTFKLAGKYNKTWLLGWRDAYNCQEVIS